MKKVIATLIAALCVAAAFSQAPAKNSQVEPAKAKDAHPVKSTLKPEPDIAGAEATEAKPSSAAKKVEKHKKAKEQKKAAKSETDAESKTGPAPESK